MSAHPRLSLNQATIKHADLATALSVTRGVGIAGIGLWREPVAEVGLGVATRMLAESGLRLSSLCRAGFFTRRDEGLLRTALDENRRAIEETAALAAAGAPGSVPVLIPVSGGLPEGDRDLPGAWARARDAVGALVENAAAAGVVLAIEPMHPIYAADRGVICTVGQALDIAEQFPAETVGIVLDTFHVWWDPQLDEQIVRAGRAARIAGYQVCDWLTPLPDPARQRRDGRRSHRLLHHHPCGRRRRLHRRHRGGDLQPGDLGRRPCVDRPAHREELRGLRRAVVLTAGVRIPGTRPVSYVGLSAGFRTIVRE